MTVVVADAVHRLTVVEYQRIGVTGVVATAWTEPEGEVIVDMSPTGREPARLVDPRTAL